MSYAIQLFGYSNIRFYYVAGFKYMSHVNTWKHIGYASVIEQVVASC